MLPNTVLVTILTVAITAALDPLTLRPMQRGRDEELCGVSPHTLT